jgi:hypothetical protein
MAVGHYGDMMLQPRMLRQVQNLIHSALFDCIAPRVYGQSILLYLNDLHMLEVYKVLELCQIVFDLYGAEL